MDKHMNARPRSRRGAARRRSPGLLRRRAGATAVLVALATLWSATTAYAQLDPLLFIKRVPPTVIVVFDTSMRMLEDGNGNWYDPNFYVTASEATAGCAPPVVTVNAGPRSPPVLA